MHAIIHYFPLIIITVILGIVDVVLFYIYLR